MAQKILTTTSPTPFDNVLAKLNNKPSPGKSKEKVRSAIAFAQVLRIRYLQMLKISEKFWQMHNDMLAGKPPDLREFSRNESVEAKINYFGFIEELNRFGRLFEKTHLLPDFYRI